MAHKICILFFNMHSILSFSCYDKWICYVNVNIYEVYD